jgi:hypothetical protein
VWARIPACGFRSRDSHGHVSVHRSWLGGSILPSGDEARRVSQLLGHSIRYGGIGQHLLPHACDFDSEGLVCEDSTGIFVCGKSTAIMLQSQLCCVGFPSPRFQRTRCGTAPHKEFATLEAVSRGGTGECFTMGDSPARPTRYIAVTNCEGIALGWDHPAISIGCWLAQPLDRRRQVFALSLPSRFQHRH